MCLQVPQTQLQAKLFAPRCIINVIGPSTSEADSKASVQVLSVRTIFCTNTLRLPADTPLLPAPGAASAPGTAKALLNTRDTAWGGTATAALPVTHTGDLTANSFVNTERAMAIPAFPSTASNSILQNKPGGFPLLHHFLL